MTTKIDEIYLVTCNAHEAICNAHEALLDIKYGMTRDGKKVDEDKTRLFIAECRRKLKVLSHAALFNSTNAQP